MGHLKIRQCHEEGASTRAVSIWIKCEHLNPPGRTQSVVYYPGKKPHFEYRSTNKGVVCTENLLCEDGESLQELLLQCWDQRPRIVEYHSNAFAQRVKDNLEAIAKKIASFETSHE